MRGRMMIDGLDTRQNKPRVISEHVGTVFQDPENQFLMLTVSEEIAFGLRNTGLEENEVSSMTGAIAGKLGITGLLGKSIFELSSGQKQLVALASTLSCGPSHILLDEPTSQLDGRGARLFFSHLRDICSKDGVTAIVSEHRVERGTGVCSRFIGIEEGKITVDGSSDDMNNWYGSKGVDVSAEGGVRNARRAGCKAVLDIQNLGMSYGDVPVLKDVTLTVHEGEIVALLGANGSGKTSILKSVMNFTKKESGSISLDGCDITDTPSAVISRKIGYLSHNPLNYLFHPTLREELDFSLGMNDGADAGLNGDMTDITRMLGLEEKLESFPREFSCGERELAAIACTLVGNRRCLLLDEPTRGMDYWKKNAFLGLVAELCAKRRMACLIATHDASLVSSWADRAIVMSGGIAAEVDPTDVWMLKENA